LQPVVGAGPSAAQAPTALAEMNAVGHIKFEAKGKKGKKFKSMAKK